MSCTLALLAQQRANLVAACHACVLEAFLNGFLHDFLYLRSVCTFLALHAWHTVMFARWREYHCEHDEICFVVGLDAHQRLSALAHKSHQVRYCQFYVTDDEAFRQC